MNRFQLIIVSIAGLALVFSLTGFQCSSAESTSAKLYIQRNDWPNAESALTKEVEKNPANSEAWYLLGDVRRQRGNFAGMVEAFDHSLATGSEFVEKIRMTRLNVWGTKLNEGVSYYNRSINASGDSASDMRKKAIEAYDIAIMSVPDSATPYQNKAFACRAEGDFEQEISNLKFALDRKKNLDLSTALINAYIRKGTDLVEKGDSTAALVNFNDAITTIHDARKLYPDNPDLLKTLIDLYIETGKPKEAIPLMREALENDPSNKSFQNNLGLLLMQDPEGLEEAVTHFDGAIEADSSYEDGLWNGAVAYMRLGEKMKKDVEAKADPKNKENIDKSYVEKFKVAVRLAERLTSLKADEARYWDGLGTAYANSGMAKEAQKAYEKADKLRGK